MSTSIIVNAKQVGHKKNLLADTTFGYPTALNEVAGYLSLGDLIRHIVMEEVAAFEKRQSKRQFYALMTPQQINQGIARGKVNAEIQDHQQKVELRQAIENAYQAFTDGLFFIFVDDVQYTDLNHSIFIAPGATISFIRLVALVGG